MPWTSAAPQNFTALLRLLLQHEYYSCSLISRFVQSKENTIRFKFHYRTALFVHGSQNCASELTSLCYIDEVGFAFVIFDPRYAGTEFFGELSELVSPYLPAIFSCMGSVQDCAQFIEYFRIIPQHKRYYTVMTKPQGMIDTNGTTDTKGMSDTEATGTLPSFFQIDVANTQHFTQLIPLQIAYIKEEVLLPGQRLNTQAIQKQFMKLITARRVYFARHSGRAVAKLHVNAACIRWNQIGGVYTSTQYRRRGIARALVEHLLLDSLSYGRSFTLFVNNSNVAAQKLYLHCGFRIISDLMIFYT